MEKKIDQDKPGEYTFKRCQSLKNTLDTLVEGIIQAYKDCPDSQNKTFEEVAEWAGRHVILNESDPNETKNICNQNSKKMKNKVPF